ncbi:MAG: nitroreductase family protein [Bacteroidales bacterium]|nr:nitroreductase family protein [Bacteroidales bacterium]
MIKDLILKNRSYRRFYEDYRISLDTLKELINLARLSPSAKNAQPLKYILSAKEEMNEKIFPCLTWAVYLKNWVGPKVGERPSAYIVMIVDTSITTEYYCDHGIAAQSILLGAVEKGLGGCIIASIQKEKLRKELNIPDHLELLQVIALGKPKEKVIIENINENGDFKYWRDEKEVHHVPKRKLDDLIIS